MTKIKICGLKTEQMLEVAIASGADFVGLVHFDKSPRHVDLKTAAKLAAAARGRISVVVLLVDPDVDLVTRVVREVAPDYIQLHGRETPEQVERLRHAAGMPVIKAVAVADREDVQGAAAYQQVADLILFDAKPSPDAKLPGGNGIPFDWNLLKGFNSEQDFMLSGGLDPQTVAEAVRCTRAPIVDVSSGVERARGIKDADKIRQFIEAVRRADRTAEMIEEQG